MYKGKGAVASLEILLHAIYYHSPQLLLLYNSATRRCDHPALSQDLTDLRLRETQRRRATIRPLSGSRRGQA